MFDSAIDFNFLITQNQLKIEYYSNSCCKWISICLSSKYYIFIFARKFAAINCVFPSAHSTWISLGPQPGLWVKKVLLMGQKKIFHWTSDVSIYVRMWFKMRKCAMHWFDLHYIALSLHETELKIFQCKSKRNLKWAGASLNYWGQNQFFQQSDMKYFIWRKMMMI